jgi:hypothetical protein
MKIIKMIKLLVLSGLLLALFSGCGESSNKHVFGNSSTDAAITINAGDTNQILEGDVLEPNSASTRIEVEHIIDDDTKYVTVLSGSATLLRGSYAVK